MSYIFVFLIGVAVGVLITDWLNKEILKNGDYETY